MFSELLPITNVRDYTPSTLDQRRKETDALRDLWVRSKISQPRLSRLRDRSSLSTTPLCGDDSKSDSHQRCSEEEPFAGDLEINLKVKHRSQHQGKTDEIITNTAITTRPDKDSTRRKKFNALNTKLLHRLPNIYDSKAGVASYAVYDIGEWRNEVRKKVPNRPLSYASPSPVFRSHTAHVKPFVRETIRDSNCFFRSTTAHYKGKGKEYMIDPEWPSESPREILTDRPMARLICNWVG